MIYAAFSLYLLGILFAGLGIYRLWADILRPRWVGWALLPGTVVSEMAYIFGCLITGGEVRRAKLMDGREGSHRRRKGSPDQEAEPTTETAPKFRLLGPVVAAFTCILACGAGIVIAHALLGKPVIEEFVRGGRLQTTAALPNSFPTSTGMFWDGVVLHVGLLQRMSATWLEVNWLDWRVPLFVYLTVCLSIRLAPVRRSLRATLLAVVALAAIIALLGVISSRFDGLMRNNLWPLVTYIWTVMMFVLFLTLIVRGGVGLVSALSEKDAPKAGPPA